MVLKALFELFRRYVREISYKTKTASVCCHTDLALYRSHSQSRPPMSPQTEPTLLAFAIVLALSFASIQNYGVFNFLK